MSIHLSPETEWNFLSIYPPSNLALNDLGGRLDPPDIGMLQAILGDDRLQWGTHGAGGAIDTLSNRTRRPRPRCILLLGRTLDTAPANPVDFLHVDRSCQSYLHMSETDDLVVEVKRKQHAG